MMSAFWIRIGRSANQRTVSACHGSRVSATLTTIILIIMITFKAAGCLRHPHTPRYLSPTKMNQQLPSLHMSTLQSSNQAASFKRSNPRGDLYQIESFHHVEFYCGDATSVYKRLTVGLGLELVSKSDQSTGNKEHASYVLQSGNARIICTAPYGGEEVDANSDSNSNSNNVDTQEKHRKDATVLPGFSRDIAVEFFNRHGLAIRAVAIEVADVAIAYDTMLSRGAVSRLSPQIIEDKDQKGFVTIAEVQLYGDVVLRLLDVKHFHGQFLPNFEDVNQRINENIFHGNSTVARPLGASSGVFKIDRFDHVVGNLWSLQPTMGLLKNITVSGIVNTIHSGEFSVAHPMIVVIVSLSFLSFILK